MVAKIAQQRGFADAGLTPKDQNSAPAAAGALQ